MQHLCIMYNTNWTCVNTYFEFSHCMQILWFEQKCTFAHSNVFRISHTTDNDVVLLYAIKWILFMFFNLLGGRFYFNHSARTYGVAQLPPSHKSCSELHFGSRIKPTWVVIFIFYLSLIYHFKQVAIHSLYLLEREIHKIIFSGFAHDASTCADQLRLCSSC